MINQDKINSSETSSSGIKNLTESNTLENNSNLKYNLEVKNYMKLYFSIQPNTLENTKLLTITMIDYSEILNELQLENIVKSIFKIFEEMLLNNSSLTKNLESIIINANINIVYNFWALWLFPLIGDGLVTQVKFDGDPRIVGTKVKYYYLKKYFIISEILEVNSYSQEENHDDSNEWNYKNKAIFENGQYEIFNAVFISCENGTKTYLSVENDINPKTIVKEVEELSKRKLFLINSLKYYIENNKEFVFSEIQRNKTEKNLANSK